MWYTLNYLSSNPEEVLLSGHFPGISENSLANLVSKVRAETLNVNSDKILIYLYNELITSTSQRVKETNWIYEQ